MTNYQHPSYEGCTLRRLIKMRQGGIRMKKYQVVSSNKEALQAALADIHGVTEKTPIEVSEPWWVNLKKINPEPTLIVSGMLPKSAWNAMPGKPGWYQHNLLPVSAVDCDSTNIYW